MRLLAPFYFSAGGSYNMSRKEHKTAVTIRSDKPKSYIWVSLRKYLKARDFKSFFHSARIYMKMRMTDIPHSVAIEPINKCNLKCPMCILNQSKLNRKRQEMSYENFKYIVDEIKDYTQAVYFGMAGEPLLNRHIVAMVGYASQKGLHVVMDTNATLLTEELSEGLIESGLDTINVSLDGSSRESYENFRVNASFEQTVKNIATLCSTKRRMKKVTPIIVLQCVANKLNENELPEVLEICRELGADRFYIAPLFIPRHIFDEDTCEDMAAKFLPTNPDVKTGYRRRHAPSCAFWAKNTVILVDGTVTMCCWDLNGYYSFGNVYKDKFIDIWNSEKYRYYRNNLILHRKLPLCTKCRG